MKSIESIEFQDQSWLIKNTGHFQAYMEVRMKQLTEMWPDSTTWRQHAACL